LHLGELLVRFRVDLGQLGFHFLLIEFAFYGKLHICQTPMKRSGSIYIVKPANLRFTTFSILQNLALLLFESFVVRMANDAVPAALQTETPSNVVRIVVDEDALDEVTWLDVVVEAAKKPVVDLQVPGGEQRGRPKALPECVLRCVRRI
jgi:hypothetical protein